MKSIGDFDKLDVTNISHETNMVSKRVHGSAENIIEDFMHKVEMVSTIKNNEKGTKFAVIANNTSNGIVNPAFSESQMDLNEIKWNQVKINLIYLTYLTLNNQSICR